MSDNWRDVDLLGDDHYDAAVVMGDDTGMPAASMPAPVDGTKAILRQAQAQRVAPPALHVEPAHPADDVYADPVVDEDDTGAAEPDTVEVFGESLVDDGEDTGGAEFSDVEDENVGYTEIVGGYTEIVGRAVYPDEGSEDMPGAMFSSPQQGTDFPILTSIFRAFAMSLPPPRVVRLDTEESYVDEVVGRSVDERLSDLEDEFAQHVSDGHGGGHDIPLSLPPGTEGKVRTWRSGDRICATICLPGCDGGVRLATATAPAEAHRQEVLGYAHAAGVDAGSLLPSYTVLGDMLGAGALVAQLASAAPSLLACASHHPYVGRMRHNCEPALAATMALQQRAQRGDKAAHREIEKLAAMGPEAHALLEDARARLLGGQVQKAAGDL